MARPRKNAAASRASLLPESAPLPEIPVQEQPYPLPEGWKWVRLIHEFAECLDSFRKPVNAAERLHRKGAIPYYGATGQVGWIDDYLTNEHLVLLGEDGAPFFDPLKDKAYIISGKAWVNNHAHILRSRFGESGNIFLMHYLNSFNYNGYINGTTRPKLTQANLGLIPIPLPPREEQERIVGHIESLFARLDEARQKAEAVRDSVALRRAAILHKAFTGELTAKWREEQGISKESWEEKDFAHIITNIEAGKNVRCEERPPHENEVGIIKVSAVTWGFFNEMESKTCHDSSLYNENIQIKRGDFLFSRANTIQLVGNCVIVENITKKLMLSDKILRFSIDRCILKNYLLFFSMSQKYRRQIENTASGNQDGMRNISQKKLLELTIPLPTLPEQQEIVRILDDLLGREQRIREAANAVVAHIERMKKAILARAFRGELGRADRPSRP